MNASRTPSVPAVERALGILDALAQSRNGLSLSQLVESSQLPKSSTHCLLLTLERAGYLHRSSQTGRYTLGLKVFGLANASLNGLPMREQAAPFLLQLKDATGLTVHMGVQDGYEAVLIAKYDPPGTGGAATWRGKRMELHSTGIGKAIAAFLPEDEIRSIHGTRKFPRHNENTVCNIRKLLDDFAISRQRGYVVDDEESELGWRCLGAPVLNDMGQPVAAVSVAGTLRQIRPENMRSLAETLKACAAAISYSWGYSRNSNSKRPESAPAEVVVDAYQRA